MYILNLTLRKDPYDVMIISEKTEEYRNKSKWVMSRLNREKQGKLKISHIKFRNGYNKNAPYFVVEYKGYEIIDFVDKEYSNGLKLNLHDPGNIVKIKLGEIIERFP